MNARQDGQTLLSLAVYISPNTVPLILQHGANINAKDRSGETPLHQAVEEGNRVTAALLVRHGARDETNPIFDAIAHGDIDSLKRTLNKLSPDIREAELAKSDIDEEIATQAPGQNPKRPIWNDETIIGSITPLDAAIFWHRADMIPLLLAKGAKINEKDDYGNTPLHVAVGLCDKEMVLQLLAHGADVNAKTLFQGPRMNAESDGLTPLHIAAQSCGRDMVILLLSHGAKVNASDSNGETPLFYAIDRGNPQIVAALLSKRADPNVKNTDERKTVGGGETPLHQAIIDINYVDDDGVKTTTLSIMTLLLSHGANVNAQDNRGFTPLGLTQQNDAVTALLRQHGGRNFGRAEFSLPNGSVESVIYSSP